jgi:uncharacterized protein
VGFFRTQGGRLRLIWRLLLFILLLVLFTALGSLLALRGLPGQTVPFLLGGLASGWVLLAMDGREPGALGFYLAPSAGKESLAGLGLGVAVAGGVILAIAALGGVRWSGMGGTSGEYLLGGAAALWLFAIPAAAEEALLRGYLFQSLAEGWGAVRALWFTSVVFGLLHLGNPNVATLGFVSIVVAGLFLGVIYLRTASLWWATGAHLGWNWAHGFLAGLPVSGLDLVESPLVEAHVRGAHWVSGGAFGPEGSVVAPVVLGVSALVLWRAPWLSPGARAVEVRPLVLFGESDGSPRGLGEGTWRPVDGEK